MPGRSIDQGPNFFFYLLSPIFSPVELLSLPAKLSKLLSHVLSIFRHLNFQVTSALFDAPAYLKMSKTFLLVMPCDLRCLVVAPA